MSGPSRLEKAARAVLCAEFRTRDVSNSRVEELVEALEEVKHIREMNSIRDDIERISLIRDIPHGPRPAEVVTPEAQAVLEAAERVADSRETKYSPIGMSDDDEEHCRARTQLDFAVRAWRASREPKRRFYVGEYRHGAPYGLEWPVMDRGSGVPNPCSCFTEEQARICADALNEKLGAF